MAANKTYLQSLKMAHRALLAGQCVLLGISFYLVLQKKITASKELDKALQVAAILVSFAAVWAASIIVKQQLAKINITAKTMQEKRAAYRKLCILQWALIEVAVFFCTVCFFIAGNFSFAALAVVQVIYFALQAPNKIKMMLQLGLSENEVDTLQ